MAPTEGYTKKHSAGLRERSWRILRRGAPETLRSLLCVIADGHEKDARGNLGRYLVALERVGVLERLPERLPGAALTSPGYVQWVLAKNLGPDAPILRKGGAVWDPNGKTLVVEGES